jgi:hypothetical protein
VFYCPLLGRLSEFGTDLFAPASPDRARIVPKIRGALANDRDEASGSDRQRALMWAQRLKRMCAIEICRHRGGRLRLIASIEAPVVIERILEHLDRAIRPSSARSSTAWPGSAAHIRSLSPVAMLNGIVMLGFVNALRAWMSLDRAILEGAATD